MERQYRNTEMIIKETGGHEFTGTGNNKLEQAAKLVLDEFANWYDGPGYFPSSFVAAIIRLRRALESK